MKRTLAALLLFVIAGCGVSRKTPSLCLKKVSFQDLPGWKADDLRPALKAFKKSCIALKKQERSKRMGLSMSIGLWHDVCEKACAVPITDPKKARQFFEREFTPYQCSDQTRDKVGLYTGYYESELHGDTKPSEHYKHPLYRRPADLIKKGKKYGRKGFFSFKPHYSRAEINRGALSGKNLELLWVDSDVDAFFLHVQGSGRIKMSNGKHIKVGYDGANGHPYTSIGKILIEQGEIEKKDISMQSIRQWIKKNPYKGKKLMEKNASYVFFKTLKDHGAIGAQGIPVSTGRTLAVDKRFIPYGVPIWLDVTHRENQVFLQRLVIAQDTGGAIKGPLRGDVFWGFSPMAAQIAGRMKAKGWSYLLLPRRVSFEGCHRG